MLIGARPIFGDRSSAAAALATLATLIAMEASDVATRPAAGDDVHDEGTARLFAVGMAVAVATGGASLLRRDGRTLPRSRAGFWGGLLVSWAGIGVNRWARSTLASNYRPVVTVVEDQEVVDHGPYTLVRHPMYLGTTMICLGVAAALSTGPTAAAWALPPLALVRRIAVEERTLTAGLGERYEAFAASRARLVPGLW